METTMKNENHAMTDCNCFPMRAGGRRLPLLLALLLVCVCAKGAVVPNDELQLTLTAGWNWIGFIFLPTSHKVGDVLGKTGFTANDAIQTNNGSSRFTGAAWLPSNFALEYGKMYQVYVSNPVTVKVAGSASGLTSLPVVVGWNWICNPTMTTVTPSQLTHSAGWTAGDRIQSTSGTVTYTGSKWLPSTGFVLEPSKGFQIYSAKVGTISF